jgi:hypothetical protein
MVLLALVERNALVCDSKQMNVPDGPFREGHRANVAKARRTSSQMPEARQRMRKQVR